MAAAGAALWPSPPAASEMRTRGPFVPVADGECAGGVSAMGAGGPVYRWRGSALGVRARIVLYGADADRGSRLRPGWEAELRRLDGIFSLYRSGSALRRLNRDGVLDAPPLELVELLSVCRGLHRATGGVFDPHRPALVGTLRPLVLPVAERRRRPGPRANGSRPSISSDFIGWRSHQPGSSLAARAWGSP